MAASKSAKMNKTKVAVSPAAICIDVEQDDEHQDEVAAAVRPAPRSAGRMSTEKDGKNRRKNKLKADEEVAAIFAHNPDDVYGVKWKIRHMIRFHSSVRFDIDDSLLMAVSIMADHWADQQKAFVDANKLAVVKKVTKKKNKPTTVS